MLETGQRIGPTRTTGALDDWHSIMQAAGVLEGYGAKYGEVAKDNAIVWILRDKSNRPSVPSSIESARSNARLARTALTHEAWEAVNSCWMAVCDAMARRVGERELPRIIGLIRQHSALVRGSAHGRMLKNDIYDFFRTGTLMERADNTARILDVTYYVILPSAMAVGSSLDNVQWHTILRSVGSEDAYRLTYGTSVKPSNIASLSILDPRVPRSRRFCMSKLQDNFNYLSLDYGQELDCQVMAQALGQILTDRHIQIIFEYDLHEYIQAFLTGLASLGRQIEIDHRFHA